MALLFVERCSACYLICQHLDGLFNDHRHGRLQNR